MRLPKPALLLNGRDCAGIAGPLRDALAQADKRGLPVDAHTRDTIVEIATLAEEWIELHLSTPPGTRGIPQQATRRQAETVDDMTTAQVAEELGITPRAVVGLANRRTLRGVRTQSGWRFARGDVAQHIADRTETPQRKAG